MAQAKGVVQGAVNEITRSANLAKNALAGLGVGLSAGALASMALGINKAVAALDDMAEVTGAAVAELSKLQTVAKIGGHDFSLVEDSLVKLTKGLKGTEEETKNARNALDQLGIKSKTAAGQLRDPGEITREVAAKFATFRDGAAKTAFALDIFGKSGAKLLPFLKDMAEEGAVAARVTAEQAAQAEILEKNLNRLKIAGEDARREFVMANTGWLVEFTEKLLDAQKAAGGLAAGLATMVTAGTRDPAARLAQIDTEIEQAEQHARVAGKLGSFGWTSILGLGAKAGAAGSAVSVGRLMAEREYLVNRVSRNARGLAEDASGNWGEAPALPRGVRKPPPDSGSVDHEIQLLSGLKEQLARANGEASAFDTTMRKLTEGTKAYSHETQAAALALAGEIDLHKRLEDQLKAEGAAVEANLAGVEKFGAGKAELVRGYAEEIQALQLENHLISASSAEREKAVAFRRIELEAQRASIGQTAAEILTIYDLANAQKAAVGELIDSRASREKSREAAQAAAREWENASRDIERALADSLMRGGRSALDYIKDIFRTAILQPIFRPVAQAATSFMQGAVGSVFGGSGGGGGFGGGFSFPSPASFMNFGFGGGAISGSAAAAEIAALTGSGTAAGASVGAASGLSAAMPWLAGGLLAANALGLFGDEEDKRKPSALGLKHEMGRFWFHQDNVPGGEANLALYRQIEADLNDPAKYDPSTLMGLLGMIEGDKGESAESLVQKLMSRAGPAANMASARTSAREAILAAQDPRGYWGGKVGELGSTLGTSATTIEAWREQFLAALDDSLTAGQLENWQKLGDAIERASQAAGSMAGSVSARGFRTLAEYQYAQRTGDHSGSVEMQAIAVTNARLLKIFERWDGDGMPAERDV